MLQGIETAVEITKGDDHLDIWVDANNNGVRDDDDVNIYVTKNGSIYATSPMFKRSLDHVLRDRLRDAAVSLLIHPKASDPEIEHNLRALSLEMVVKAIAPEEVAH